MISKNKTLAPHLSTVSHNLEYRSHCNSKDSRPSQIKLWQIYSIEETGLDHWLPSNQNCFYAVGHLKEIFTALFPVGVTRIVVALQYKMFLFTRNHTIFSFSSAKLSQWDFVGRYLLIRMVLPPFNAVPLSVWKSGNLLYLQHVWFWIPFP